MSPKVASKYMVSNMDELLDSIKHLDSLLANDPSFVFFDGKPIQERIRKGKNFVCYQIKGKDKELKFLPSRTVGYRFSLWGSEEPLGRDGRKTTPAIVSILGHDAPDEELEKAFKKYCKKLGIKPSKAEKRPRTYWQPIIIDGDVVTGGNLHSTMTNALAQDKYPESLRKELEQELKRLAKRKQERLVEQKQRNYQKDLRDYLLAVRKSCEVAGVHTPELLVASHIKPWAECETDDEKLDPCNVLLLSANFDKLFDQGFISFSDEGKILISEALSQDERRKLGLSEELILINGVPERMKKYLGWHREHRFKNKNS